MSDDSIDSSIPLPPDAEGPMPTPAHEHHTDRPPVAAGRFAQGNNEGYFTLVWRRFRRSIIGMIGVLVIMLGKLGQAGYASDALLGMLAIIASAILYAYNLILARRQALVASPLEIAFLQNLVVAVTLGLAAPWLGVVPTQEQWLPLAGVTALALCGHYLMSWSYARAEAQYLIPTEYSAFVWAILLGWVFFHENVTWPTMAGAFLIIAGCLIASRAKPKLAKPIEAAAV